MRHRRGWRKQQEEIRDLSCRSHRPRVADCKKLQPVPGNAKPPSGGTRACNERSGLVPKGSIQRKIRLGSFLCFLFLPFLSKCFDHVALSLVSERRDGLLLRELFGGRHDQHFLGAGLFACLNLHFSDSLKLLERRTDVLLTASSSDTSHSDHVSGPSSFVLRRGGHKSDGEGQDSQKFLHRFRYGMRPDLEREYGRSG